MVFKRRKDILVDRKDKGLYKDKTLKEQNMCNVLSLFFLKLKYFKRLNTFETQKKKKDNEIKR